MQFTKMKSLLKAQYKAEEKAMKAMTKRGEQIRKEQAKTNKLNK